MNFKKPRNNMMSRITSRLIDRGYIKMLNKKWVHWTDPEYETGLDEINKFVESMIGKPDQKGSI